MLGTDVYRILTSRDEYNVIGVDRRYSPYIYHDKQIIGDLCDNSFVRNVLEAIQPDIIIHCAAIVDVNVCEQEKALANAVHVKVTQKLAAYRPELTRMIYISTDSVFDGTRGNYTEDDIPNPVNYYAQSKLEGERQALKHNPQTLVLRTNIYGFTHPNGNSLAQWALGNLEQGKKIQGFTDVIFNAIYTKQFARIIQKLLVKNNYHGILNVAGNQFMSKYQFLVEIARCFNFSTDLIEKSVSTDFNFKAPRPLNTTLNVDRLKNLDISVPIFHYGLKEFCIDYKKNNNKENRHEEN